jgi:hypothetical protein
MAMNLTFDIELYTNYLKNREFGKEAPQNHCLERMTIAGPQGMSENNGFGEKPTPPKPDSSSSLCIIIGVLATQGIRNYSDLTAIV